MGNPSKDIGNEPLEATQVKTPQQKSTYGGKTNTPSKISMMPLFQRLVTVKSFPHYETYWSGPTLDAYTHTPVNMVIVWPCMLHCMHRCVHDRLAVLGQTHTFHGATATKYMSKH